MIYFCEWVIPFIGGVSLSSTWYHLKCANGWKLLWCQWQNKYFTTKCNATTPNATLNTIKHYLKLSRTHPTITPPPTYPLSHSDLFMRALHFYKSWLHVHNDRWIRILNYNNNLSCCVDLLPYHKQPSSHPHPTTHTPHTPHPHISSYHSLFVSIEAVTFAWNFLTHC